MNVLYFSVNSVYKIGMFQVVEVLVEVLVEVEEVEGEGVDSEEVGVEEEGVEEVVVEEEEDLKDFEDRHWIFVFTMNVTLDIL